MTPLRRCSALLLALHLGLIGCSIIAGSSDLDEGCPSGLKACDGRCVRQDDPDYGCAAPDCRPCVLNNATARCHGGECLVAGCYPAGQYDDCNHDGDMVGTDGCEIDIDHDAQHCGGCDRPPCEVANGTAGCGGGRCSIHRCDADFRDCNLDASDGCEAALLTSRLHCGACDVPCQEPKRCEQGVCADGP